MLKLNGILAVREVGAHVQPHFVERAANIDGQVDRAGRLRTKRLIDFGLALSGIMALAPFLLICMAVIMCVSPGPAIYSQIRIGFEGAPFRIFKFRTMHCNADATELALDDDRRRTFWFGGLLRRLSFDEVPQLFNVVRGEMSLVGPRPHMVGQRIDGVLFEDAVFQYSRRHQMMPGMTGWAQINGCRGPVALHADIARRVAHDLFYIEQWSIKMDLLILLRTICFGFISRRPL